MHNVSVSVFLPSAGPDLILRYTGSKLEESHWLQNTLLKERRKSGPPLSFTPAFSVCMDVPAYVEFCCISIISPLADQTGKKEVRLLELSPIVLIRGSSLVKDYSLYLVTPLP